MQACNRAVAREGVQAARNARVKDAEPGRSRDPARRRRSSRERPSEIGQGGHAPARHSSRGFAIGIVLLLIAGLLIAGYVAHLRVREDGRAGATASDEVDRPQVFQGSTAISWC